MKRHLIDVHGENKPETETQPKPKPKPKGRKALGDVALRKAADSNTKKTLSTRLRRKNSSKHFVGRSGSFKE
jgi:hypothetical protein